MKWTIALGALVLAGCAPETELERSNQATLAYMRQPEVRARLDASAEEGRRALPGILASRPREVIEREARDQDAAVICHERGNMAAAQPAYGGRGLAGAINAGFQQGFAGDQVAGACWRAYQATGMMPSY